MNLSRKTVYKYFDWFWVLFCQCSEAPQAWIFSGVALVGSPWPSLAPQLLPSLEYNPTLMKIASSRWSWSSQLPSIVISPQNASKENVQWWHTIILWDIRGGKTQMGLLEIASCKWEESKCWGRGNFTQRKMPLLLFSKLKPRKTVFMTELDHVQP